MFSSQKEEARESRPLTDRLEESEEDYDSRDSIDHALPAKRPSKRRSNTCVYIAIAALFLVSNIISLFLGGLIYSQATDLDSECAAHTTKYSPLLKDVQIKYADKPFNGSFMEVDVFRQDGGPEVDAAWESLGVDYRAGVIPYSEGLKSGLTSAHVQRAEKYGGGFFVNVEGMHHLHCLNLVRKSLYFNYEHYKDLGMHAFKNDEPILRLHVTHCLDTIRQVLMCNADTAVLGQVWSNKASPAAFPDFKTTHMCKNYDDIRQWADKLQAPPVGSLPKDYMKLPDPKDVLEYTP